MRVWVVRGCGYGLRSGHPRIYPCLSLTAIDDGLAIYEYLKEQEAYLEKNIVMMTDSCDNPNMTATRENILREIENLMVGMQAGVVF
ncbi:hypothetical protein PHLGIDRAFT_121872 [Phlebiopsis gigantea 11061_1 CR5-6]|uniref:Uncharacterized protein n=1 Tax=Phlebiopsis gigantea (strain 11061_1 CR5-6) TaxID=745531 RepID=A0A0C3NEM9_PHLG1|nr:hypothetical protein PHLGIDRAFT_121872 [Phlebiopsis gigantea 11061_1 CR5-6]